MNNNNKSIKISIIICSAIIVIAAVVVAAVLIISSGDGKLEKQLELGQKYLDEMEYEEAIAYFEKALEIDPLCIEAYVGIADAYIGLEDYDEAVKILKKARKNFEKAAKKDDSKAIKKALKQIEEKEEEVSELMGEDTSPVPEPEPEPEPDTEVPAAEEQTTNLPPRPVYDYSDINDPFQVFAGQYTFSSGAGGWGTELIINEDGSYEVFYGDSDMGCAEPSYPNGTYYCGEAYGTFESVERIDEFTFRAYTNDMTITTPTGTEEIVDGTLRIYTEIYGFENGAVEFYLPGKPVKDVKDDVVSWLGFSYGAYWPVELSSLVVCNIPQGAGFMTWENDYSFAKDYNLTSAPDGVPVSSDSILSGTYTGADGCVMYIDMNGTGVENGSGYIGTISYDESKFREVEYRSTLVIGKDEKGYYAVSYYYNDYNQEYSYSTYKPIRIVVSDATPGGVAIGIYDEDGTWYNTYIMN